MCSRQTWVVVVGLVAALLLATLPAEAGIYVTQGPFVRPMAGDGVPGPKQVPGKEYSNNSDRNAHPSQAVNDPGQVVAWDGNGGTANTTDFAPATESGTGDPQVDALANKSDALFMEVISNNAALLFSSDLDKRILYERTSGGGGVWASPSDIDQIDPDDVDGLEVWGPGDPGVPLEEKENDSVTGGFDGPGADDANRYSKIGDPGFGVSVFDNLGNAVFTPAHIANAINPLFPNLNITDDLIDLDAMMMRIWNNINNIMFSIDPISDPNTGAVVADGGEIFVWDGVTLGGAQFLWHGGHLWDTAFGVQATYGTATENINALEAVAIPEPGSIAVWALLGLFFTSFARRRRRSRV